MSTYLTQSSTSLLYSRSVVNHFGVAAEFVMTPPLLSFLLCDPNMISVISTLKVADEIVADEVIVVVSE